MALQLNRLCLASLAALAAVVGPMCMSQAQAQSSFSFNLSFSEAVLNAYGTPEYDTIAHYEAWDSAFARVAKRNMPFIEITNTSTSATPLTQFQMTIAKPEFDFSDDVLLSYAKLGTSTPGISFTSSSPDAGDTLLVVNFTDGLLPNETVRFQVDIDVNDAYPDLYPHPDYRMVFFDVNGDDDSDNSVMTAIFQTDNGPLSQSVLLPDYVQTTPVYLNGGGVRSYNTMDPAEVFGGGDMIPEPSSFAMAILALAGFRGTRRAR